MNAYMYHMLLRAREVCRINAEADDLRGVRKCPFCIADEDQQWYNQVKWKGVTEPRPKKPIAPHCEFCPLQNLASCSLDYLMNDCEMIGKVLLGMYEEVGDG